MPGVLEMTRIRRWGQADQMVEASRLSTLILGVRVASVYRNTDQTINASTMTAISFSHEHIDTADMWSSAAPTRLVVPEDGVYIALGGWSMKDSATDNKRMIILFRIDGTTYRGGGEQSPAGTSLTLVSGHMPPIWLTAGQYVEVIAYHEQAAARTLWGGSSYNWGVLYKLV